MGSPPWFFRFSGGLVKWLLPLTVCLLLVGAVWGLLIAPPDFKQGNSYRIIYIHVPSAVVALAGYYVMAFAGAVSLVWRIKMADVTMRAVAPVGAALTAIALVTGAIWGKPTWGTWWVWDARLTSVLVLLFLYIGYMALWAAMDDPVRAGRAAAVLALVGAVNLPIIKFSVDWWNTLHQPASVAHFDGPTIHESILIPLLIMAAAFKAYYAMVLMVRMRAEILERRMLVARSQHITGRG